MVKKNFGFNPNHKDMKYAFKDMNGSPNQICAQGHNVSAKSKGGKWIQSAIKHPGALHAELGVPQGQRIPAKKLEAAEKKGGKLGRRARLAETLSHLRKK